jgi:hypothetical protein
MYADEASIDKETRRHGDKGITGEFLISDF